MASDCQALSMPRRGFDSRQVGFERSPSQRFKNLAVACSVYHGMKHGHGDLIERALHDRQFEELAQQAKQQASAANILLNTLIPN